VLTDTEIRKSKPKTKPYRMTDGLGLYLMVTPTGGKLWRWKYRFRGVEKLMSFGQCPDVSLADARERLAAARKLLAGGVDPMEQRKAEKAARSDSFESVAALWLDHWKVDKSERHVGTTERRLQRNVFPMLGAKAMDAIEAADLVKMARLSRPEELATLRGERSKPRVRYSATPSPTDTPSATPAPISSRLTCSSQSRAGTSPAWTRPRYQCFCERLRYTEARL
jgi:hypothetical protein